MFIQGGNQIKPRMRKLRVVIVSMDLVREIAGVIKSNNGAVINS